MSTNADRTPPAGIPRRVLQRLAAERVDEVRLRRVSAAIADARGRMADPTAPNAWLRDLQAQRAELLARQAPALAPADVSRLRVDDALRRVGDLLFFPWQVLQLPYMTEGIYDPPGTPDVTGDLVSAGLFAGGAGFGASPGGTLTQDGGRPVERFWTRTWCNNVVFPPAPSDGRLYYRFGVNCECNVYRDPVQSGLIISYVTIGTASDVLTPIDEWTDWQTVGWPIQQDLPASQVTLDFQGGVTVTGSIPVKAGQSAAMGFIYGIVVAIEGGLLQILYGDWGTGLVGGTDYTAYDKIQYRFEPEWWLQAVAERMASTQARL